MSDENENDKLEQEHKLIDLTTLSIYDEKIKEWFEAQLVFAEEQDIIDLFDEKENE